jgi:hypothetical protein
MKQILLITMAAGLFAQTAICLAQNKEPAVEPPAGIAPSPPVGQNNVSRGSRRATTSSPANNAANGFGSGTTIFSSSKGDAIPPVMIRFSQPDAKTSAGLEEDLFVMARVISRTLDRADAENGKVAYKMNVPMLLTGSGRSVRPMYLEGLGPLFMIKVSFPLLPPPKAEEKTVRKTTTDTEWDEAQKEILGGTETWVEDADHNSNYNEEQVELLKKELIGSLKSAANMRGLKPDEFVNIAVFGHAPPLRVKSFSYPKTGDVGIGLPATAVVVQPSAAANASKGSVLTLRAKKSDIDAFASGKLDADAFSAKVMTASYAGSGIGITSINSWIQEKTGSRFQ